MSFVEILIFLPVVGAIIGYVSKWMAIRMLFKPEQWVGLGPVGWQGVVQRRAPKFAAGVADTVAGSGVDVDQLLERIAPQEVAELIGPTLDERAPPLLEQVLDEVAPGSWARMAEPVRLQLLGQVRTESRRIAAALVTALKPVARDLLDIRALVVEQLSGANANRLARLFQRVGRRELQVVIYYGAVLGFFIGLLEVAGYTWLEKWWLLPIIGAVDGLVNNWFAIRMIFRPHEKKRYFFVFPFQGLFPARQQEIAKEYAHMLATEVVAPRDIMAHAMARGGDKVLAAGMATVEREAEPLLQMLGMLTGTPPDAATRQKIMGIVTVYITATVPLVLPALEDKLRERLGIDATIGGKLVAMSKLEFERVLRGIFEEDEWILVTLGGVLGGAIGFLQAGIVLALS